MTQASEALKIPPYGITAEALLRLVAPQAEEFLTTVNQAALSEARNDQAIPFFESFYPSACIIQHDPSLPSEFTTPQDAIAIELIPPEAIDAAFDSIAGTIRAHVHEHKIKHEDVVLVTIPNGATYAGEQLLERLPDIIRHSIVELPLSHTRGTDLAETVITKSEFDPEVFAKQVAGKHVVIIEGLMDSGATMETAQRIANESGAASTVAVALLDKVGHPQRSHHTTAMKRVISIGARIPVYVWETGCGPDSLNGFGRRINRACAHFTGEAAVQVLALFGKNGSTSR